MYTTVFHLYGKTKWTWWNTIRVSGHKQGPDKTHLLGDTGLDGSYIIGCTLELELLWCLFRKKGQTLFDVALRHSGFHFVKVKIWDSGPANVGHVHSSIIYFWKLIDSPSPSPEQKSKANNCTSLYRVTMNEQNSINPIRG